MKPMHPKVKKKEIMLHAIVHEILIKGENTGSESFLQTLVYCMYTYHMYFDLQ